MPFDSDTIKNIGFVSTRFAGTDGVSLETEKWANVFEKEGFTCYYFAGELDRPPERSYLVPEAFFRHKGIREIFRSCFSNGPRGREMTEEIHRVKSIIKDQLYRFIEKFKIDLLIPENALTIPLNIPLGVALTEMIAETGVGVIAHHHDFFWERQEFKTNAAWDYLNMAFPPHFPSIRHVVINSAADNQLSLRTGISSTIIPNVMDFENPPPPPDAYASDVREALGFKEGELFILQPTRVVKRKGIEHAIEFVRRLNRKARLVISHTSGDEGYDYEARVRDYSEIMGVKTVFFSDIIQGKRGETDDGRKIYSLQDVYQQADLVTYPSNFEGFGNAFLEAIYYRKPILVNRYSIYAFDIEPKGFETIKIDGYVSEDAVRHAREVLENRELREKMVENNYGKALKYYSYDVLHKRLMSLMV
ncbi:MAG: glycosyltransferase family 4 protein [Desulfobacterales bacterium]|nr:glycosyltransferase family 4 protein [Desulfobacterales bacterium]